MVETAALRWEGALAMGRSTGEIGNHDAAEIQNAYQLPISLIICTSIDNIVEDGRHSHHLEGILRYIAPKVCTAIHPLAASNHH